MRIAMIVPSLANEGPVIVAQDLCKEYVRMGHMCKVYYFDDILDLEMPCEVEKISFWRSIDFSRWDVVHTHCLKPDLYVRLHRPVVSRKRPEFVSTQHNPISIREFRITFNWRTSIVMSVLWHVALTAFDAVVFLNSVTETSTSLLKKVRSYVIFNGRAIDPTEPLPDNDHVGRIVELKNRYLIIGTISNIVRRKGLEQMISALPQLPRCAFVAVGDGDDTDRLKSLARNLGVADRCYWVGYQDFAYKYHRLFDLFVMCTRSEGFPLALVEAAAYGTPAVLSDIPILTSIVASPVVEFYELDNIADLCRKIELVLNEKQQYGANMRSFYDACLTVDKMARNYLSVYDCSQEGLS